MTCDTLCIEISSVVYGPACVTSGYHVVQMPFHILNTENSSLVYGPACASLEYHVVQMPFHILNNEKFYDTHAF